MKTRILTVIGSALFAIPMFVSCLNGYGINGEKHDKEYMNSYDRDMRNTYDKQKYSDKDRDHDDRNSNNYNNNSNYNHYMNNNGSYWM